MLKYKLYFHNFYTGKILINVKHLSLIFFFISSLKVFVKNETQTLKYKIMFITVQLFSEAIKYLHHLCSECFFLVFCCFTLKWILRRLGIIYCYLFIYFYSTFICLQSESSPLAGVAGGIYVSFSIKRSTLKSRTCSNENSLFANGFEI